MPLNDIGPIGYHQDRAVATLGFTPQYDRAARVTKILVDKPSAGDIWRVTCGGREIAAFDIQSTGNQQPLAGPYSGYPKTNDLFDLYRYVLGERLTFPVPMGQTITVASDGAATANIQYEYEEVDPGELSPGEMNHPEGRRFVGPLVGYRAASVSAVGENTFDTQIGPKWFPNIFVDNELPPRWTVRVLCIFLEGGGRNTYSGSADVQSVTTYLGVKRNGKILYTRDALGGIPLVGQASAAGSANTVVGTDETPYPPFQESDLFDWYPTAPFLVLHEGDSYQFRLNIAGAVTGGATYASMRQLFLCDTRIG